MRSKVCIYILLLGLAIVGAYCLGQKSHKHHYIDGQQVRQGDYEFINPLLECNIASNRIDAAKKNPEKLVTKIVDEIVESGRVSKIAFYYRDLNNGPAFGINTSETFFTGSLGKLPLAMTVYRMAEKDSSVLKRQVTYQSPVFPSSQPWVATSTTLVPGATYTIEELVDIMLRYSDNQATILLIEEADPKLTQEVISLLGLDGEKFDVNKTGQIGVRQFSSFLRVLYNSSVLSRDYSEKILGILSRADFAEGMRMVFPPDHKVASKFGIAYTEAGLVQMHECGIVYYPTDAYLLCTMTEGRDLEVLKSVVRDISTVVYNEIPTGK